jgi:hypothetical protein
MISITPAHCVRAGCGLHHGRALMQCLHSPPSEHGKISGASWGGWEADQEGGRGRGLGWAWPKVCFVADYQCKDDIWPKLSPRARLRDISGLPSVRVE